MRRVLYNLGQKYGFRMRVISNRDACCGFDSSLSFCPPDCPSPSFFSFAPDFSFPFVVPFVDSTVFTSLDAAFTYFVMIVANFVSSSPAATTTSLY